MTFAKLRQILDETVDIAEDDDRDSSSDRVVDPSSHAANHLEKKRGIKTKVLNVTKEEFMKAIYQTMQKLIILQDGKEMENILKLLLSRNIAVSNQIIHIMLKYYAINGPVESAENLIEYWRSKANLTSDATSNPTSPVDGANTDSKDGENSLLLGEECYQELIDAYANFNLPWKSLHVLQTMEKENIPISLQASTFPSFPDCSPTRVL